MWIWRRSTTDSVTRPEEAELTGYVSQTGHVCCAPYTSVYYRQLPQSDICRVGLVFGP